MKYNYYYNFIPKFGAVRNNLVYTSLISEDKKTFVKWFHNDTEYHKGMNQVVDSELMISKWNREVKFLKIMADCYPEHVPNILEIDEKNQKIYLEIDGVDFWQKHYDQNCTYGEVLSDWQDQILDILRSHKNLGLWKYSMHPSSYFLVNDKLKSINYFFTYSGDEPMVSVEDHRSHISEERQKELETKMKMLGIDWQTKVPFDKLQILCFESFKNNYPDEFIERAKAIFLN